MTRARVIAATISAVAIVISGALATSAIAANDSTRRSASAETSKYVEPSSYPIADGAYLGYVRADGFPGATVAVDFVAFTSGAIGNTRPEQLVDAGALAKIGFFDRVGRPFRITVKNDTIVAVQSADDILRPLPAA